MRDPNELLLLPEFWSYYCQERPQLDVSLQEAFSELETESSVRSVTFEITSVSPYRLTVDVVLEFWMINLGLRHARGESELGWWDEARWHPYALRWDEVELLAQYWDRECGEQRHLQPAWLLLLCPFVGHGANEKRKLTGRKTAIATSWKKLGLHSDSQIKKLVPRSVLAPSEPYQWSEDPELGWTFSGEYPCYSLRNREHSEGAEGRFPFHDFRMMIQRLQSTLAD